LPRERRQGRRCKTSTFEDRIRQSRSQLSPNLQRIGDYLLDSYLEASLFTATELAHRLEVDPATVVRFCQRLGYAGFPELQRDLRARVRHELLVEPQAATETPAAAADSALVRAARHLDLTRRSFPYPAAEKLAAVLHKAKRVVLLAEGITRPVARMLADQLESFGISASLAGSGPGDMARTLSQAGAGDLVLAVEATEETPYVARALAQARASGRQTAALVAAPSSETARSADLALTIHASQDARLALVGVVAAVYALTDMLESSRPGTRGEIAKRAADFTRRLGASAEDSTGRVARPRRAGKGGKEEGAR
jgi:DNA-binding MurR/RpiR family transcriptional regulator